MRHRIPGIYEAISHTVAAAWAPLLVAGAVVVGIAR